MSGLKTIRRRIHSVKNTKQITKAMKLVSAAKLRKAQDAATGGQSYVAKLLKVLSQVMSDLPKDFSHPLFENRDIIKKRRIIIVSGERGLCGAYNANILKAVQTDIREYAQSSELEIFPIGKQASNAAKRFSWKVVKTDLKLDEDAAKWPIFEMANSLIEDYLNNQFDEVIIYYTKFVSTMTQKVTKDVILPLNKLLASSAGSEEMKGKSKYDPRPEAIFNQLLYTVFALLIKQAGLESKASEHAARMTAMDSATRNADELIEKLRLFYNRARQSAITRELIDIVGGAEAIK